MRNLVGLGGHDEVVAGYPSAFMRPPPYSGFAPGESDFWMMPLVLSKGRDFIYKHHCSRERWEIELFFEGSHLVLNDGPASNFLEQHNDFAWAGPLGRSDWLV